MPKMEKSKIKIKWTCKKEDTQALNNGLEVLVKESKQLTRDDFDKIMELQALGRCKKRI